MIYFGTKQKRVVDYGAKNYQLCWTCKNACGGCEWSRDFKPVKGWTAEKTIISETAGSFESYKITKCPKYISDRRYGSNK